METHVQSGLGKGHEMRTMTFSDLLKSIGILIIFGMQLKRGRKRDV